MNTPLPSVIALAPITLDPSQVEAAQRQLTEVGDWRQWLAQIELYAISAIALMHVQQHKLVVPPATLIALRALAIRHRAAADARYQLTQELVSAFRQQDIPLVALKGLALAPMIYPADGLRPMRDIDILVPRDKEPAAGRLLQEMGFDLPESQPSKFMRGAHQLPNATLKVNGFTISVEIHHDALLQDALGKLFYEDVEPYLQTVRWREIEFNTLGHAQMLHQVSRHLEGVHPGAILKLINVLDVVLYSEHFIDQIDWDIISRHHPHVKNTLKCLHLMVPLSEALQARVGGVSEVQLDRTGDTMLPLTHIINRRNSPAKQFSLLFMPSDWWLHLYYNVDPAKSLIPVKFVRHPLNLLRWLGKRFYSRILGG